MKIDSISILISIGQVPSTSQLRGAMTNLLLIESPGKLKKLSQILGSGWIVKASMGHVRELASDGEDSLGFDLAGDRVYCRYQPRGPRGKKTLAELRNALKTASQVYLGTDPDREGETIAWHLQQELRIRNPLRVTYSEITQSAVRQAIARPRPLDANLIAAGRARACLDKLVGYKGSPLLWKLRNGAKSMGRVQSAALHLICLRETEIVTFVPQDYWSVWVEYQEGFKAFYRKSLNPTSKQAATQKEDDAAEKSKEKPESDRVSTQAEADRLVEIARSHPHSVVKIESKNTSRNPPPPFTTSTLQQAVGSRLKWGSDKTMKVAQTLYEKGHITYMRTDSIALSPEFCAAARRWLEVNDRENVPPTAKKYRSKSGAQEAHEAVRPTHVEKTPEQLTQLGSDEGKLYHLIWNRAIASQCRPAQLQKTRVVTRSGEVFWEARGQVLMFAGYTRYWNNISSDTHLPTLLEGQFLTLKKADSEKKQTQPPPRYTEPKLVQLMERKGIGRPSTYAPTIKTLKERKYVQSIQGKKLQPTQLGLEVDQFLMQALPDLLQPEFTAKMESTLDAIAEGNEDWEGYLNTWYRNYFAPALIQATQKASTYQYQPLPDVQRAVENHRNDKESSQKLEKLADILGNNVCDRPQSQNYSSAQKLSKKADKQTQIMCPKCGHWMSKIPSKSKKLAADHFLKCERTKGGCDAVMFWSDKRQEYELPYGDRAKNTTKTKQKNTAKNTSLSTTGKNWWEQPIETPSYPKRRSRQKKRSKSKAKPPEITNINCPKCGSFMSKVFSKSQKLSADHFLKCGVHGGGCDAVMFWSDKHQQYQLPYTPPTQKLTSYNCPVCQLPLEEYTYTKDGVDKKMLRCSEYKHRRDKCQDVAFFWSRERWWSPKFGEMPSLKSPES